VHCACYIRESQWVLDNEVTNGDFSQGERPATHNKRTKYGSSPHPFVVQGRGGSKEQPGSERRPMGKPPKKI
jgi:hypothetical protein